MTSKNATNLILLVSIGLAAVIVFLSWLLPNNNNLQTIAILYIALWFVFFSYFRKRKKNSKLVLLFIFMVFLSSCETLTVVDELEYSLNGTYSTIFKVVESDHRSFIVDYNYTTDFEFTTMNRNIDFSPTEFVGEKPIYSGKVKNNILDITIPVESTDRPESKVVITLTSNSTFELNSTVRALPNQDKMYPEGYEVVYVGSGILRK